MIGKQKTALLLALTMVLGMCSNAVYALGESMGPDYRVDNPYGGTGYLIPEDKYVPKPDDKETFEVPCVNLWIGIRNAHGDLDPSEQDQETRITTKGDVRRIWKFSPEKCVPHNVGECGVKVSRLYGLEYAEDLRYLSLPYQRVTDLSPLAGLTKLVFLNLKDNEFTSPDENSMETTYRGKTTTQTPGDRITDFTPLKNLKNLEYLDVYGAKPGKTIDALSGLTKLRSLSIWANGVDNINFAKDLNELVLFNAQGNPISDISPLKGAVKIETLNLDAGNTNEGKAKLEDISLLKDMPNLTFLNISNQNVSDLSALADAEHLEEFWAINNPNLKDFSLLKKLPRLTKVVVDVKDSEAAFKEAKALYNDLNKMILSKKDKANLDKLLGASDNVKAFFSQEELKNYEELQKKLEQADTAENKLFDLKAVYEIRGAKEKGIALNVGDDESKLPETATAEVEKISGGIDQGSISTDPTTGKQTLKLAVLDSKGKLFENPVTFTLKNGATPTDTKEISSEGGYITLPLGELTGRNYHLFLNGKRMYTFMQMNGKLLTLMDSNGNAVRKREEFAKHLVIFLPEDVSQQEGEPMGKYVQGSNRRDFIKLAVKKDGKLYREPITVKVGAENGSLDSYTEYTSKDGYILLDKNTWTTYTNYRAIYNNKIVYQIGSAFTGIIEWVNGGAGKFNLTKDNSEAERRALVLDLDANMGKVNPGGGTDPGVPTPNPGEGGDQTLDKAKIGFFEGGKELRFAIVDEAGKLITEQLRLSFTSSDPGADGLRVTFDKGIYTIKTQYADYDYQPSLLQDRYEIIYRHAIADRSSGFNKVEKRYESSTPGNENKDHFIINVRKLEDETMSMPQSQSLSIAPVALAAPVQASGVREDMEIPVTWDTSNFDTSKAGTFTLKGTFQTDSRIKNTENHEATLKVTVKEAPKPVRELKVTFAIKDGDKDKGAFVKNEGDGVNSLLVLPNPYDASKLTSQAPKVDAKEGYTFEGWDKAFEGNLTADTVYYAVFKEKAKPDDPAKSDDPSKPVDPNKPVNPGKKEDHSSSGSTWFFPGHSTTPTVEKPSPSFSKAAFVEKFNIPVKGTINAPKFKDIQGTPYEKAINTIASRGMMVGMGNGLFSPKTGTTRAQFFSMLYRMSRNTEYAKGQGFPDVEGKWYNNTANWAKATGFAAGYEDGSFRGDQVMTRAELVTILYRFLEKAGVPMNAAAPSKFADDAEFQAWYRDAARALSNMGILEGEKFDAKRPVSRGELASTLEKLFEHIDQLSKTSK